MTKETLVLGLAELFPNGIPVTNFHSYDKIVEDWPEGETPPTEEAIIEAASIPARKTLKVYINTKRTELEQANIIVAGREWQYDKESRERISYLIENFIIANSTAKTMGRTGVELKDAQNKWHEMTPDDLQRIREEVTERGVILAIQADRAKAHIDSGATLHADDVDKFDIPQDLIDACNLSDVV